jgi:peptide deformylase
MRRPASASRRRRSGRTGRSSWWTAPLKSFPGAREDVERAESVRVRAQDREGKAFELETDGLLAVAIQHEYDHLQGVLMIDHLGPLKKRLLHRKMMKRAETAA